VPRHSLRRTRVNVLIICGAFMAFGCRGWVLSGLRADLAVVQEARQSKRYVDTGTRWWVCSMKGMSRSEIQDSLGKPSFAVKSKEDLTKLVCPPSAVAISFGFGGLRCAPTVASAEEARIWFYNLYALERGMVGGGTILVITFDAAGKCSSVDWAVVE
jgi:hypothetical protein